MRDIPDELGAVSRVDILQEDVCCGRSEGGYAFVVGGGDGEGDVCYCEGGRRGGERALKVDVEDDEFAAGGEAVGSFGGSIVSVD